MSKPFSILNRIFSFSKGSKRNRSNADRLISTTEHGEEPDSHDPDDALHPSGSVRTTGGIGGLGKGITNAASEIGRSNTRAAADRKGGEMGFRKRLLRRASMSASDLLSWGYEKNTRHESREHHQKDFKPRETSGHLFGEEPDQPQNLHQGHDDHDNNPHPNNRMVVGPTPNNGGNERYNEADGATHTRSQEGEELTRLLRSSSANYRIIRETDYRDMDPLEHPINAIALDRRPSIPLLSSNQANPPTAWLSQQAGSVAFPPQHVPLVHVPSVTSNSSASTYKVTVHRRRIHSRTSFPEANRALDHLHSSSPMAPTSTPSVSPHSSEDWHGTPSEEIIPRRTMVKPSGIPKFRVQSDLSQTRNNSTIIAEPKALKQQVLPSMLPRRSSKHQSPARHTEQKGLVAGGARVTSQLYPVAPLRTVPPASHRTPSLPLQASNLKNNQGPGQASRSSVRLLHQSGSSSRASNSETAFCSTATLEISRASIRNEEAYDGITKEADQTWTGHEASLTHSMISKTSTHKTPTKARNVLKKRRGKSQARIADSSVAPTEKVTSIKSEESPIGAGDESDKDLSHSNLRTVLGVLHAVGDVVERLHGSAVGEEALSPPRRQYTDDWDFVSHCDLPAMPTFASCQTSMSPHSNKGIHSTDKKATVPSGRSKLTIDSPHNRVRLARLRRDPSVVSLLDMYKSDGTLEEDAFSNTPPSKLLQRTVSDGGLKLVQTTTRLQKEANPKGTTKGGIHPESRNSQMRRAYTEALNEASPDSMLGIKSSKTPSKSPSALRGVSDLAENHARRSPPHSDLVSFHSGEPRDLDHRLAPDSRSNEALDSEFYVEEHASLSTDNGQSGLMIDVSLLVEPGSLSRANDASCESSPMVETPIEPLDAEYPLSSHHHAVDIKRNESTVGSGSIPRSPNRRASEVFAFLNRTPLDSDEMLDARYNNGGDEVAASTQISHQTNPIIHDLPQRRLTPVLKSPMQASSPSKRPSGPRTIARSNATLSLSTANTITPFNLSSHDETPQQPPHPTLPSSVPSPEGRSPEPLTGATFASDSFASQNTTDRSLYRGIYKLLNDTPAGRDKVAHGNTARSTTRLSTILPTRDFNSLLFDAVDVNKSLPTPPSPSDSDVDARTDAHKPLQILTPSSAIIEHLPSNQGNLSRHNSTKSNVAVVQQPQHNLNGTVKEKVAMWESTTSLTVEKCEATRQPPLRPGQAEPDQRSVKWSEVASSDKRDSVLRDGRTFNSSKPTGKMFGPRTPTKRPTNGTRSPRDGPTPERSNKHTDVNLGYPFSQDLFPAILSPGGPAVAKPNSYLHTPQRSSSKDEHSPASSSKLGAYGREIMALARSRSGARAKRPDANPL